MKNSLREHVAAALGDSFDIGDELGRGGMSVVYRALDLRLMRQVAIKVLPPEFAWDAGLRERFRREAQTAAQLNHPHIVPIFSVDERDDIVYFVMAECDGESLGARLARTTRAPLVEVRRILAEVADALAYAHGKGVVHRDIKPDNILIEKSSGRALVTDFGIARAAEGGARLTITGVAIGTPAYMSPEQAMGESELDARSDIYSWGAVAYRMLCGVTPFSATNTPSLLLKHVSEELVPIAARRGDAPPRLARIVERALMKKAESRWQSAQELHAALCANDVLDRDDGARVGSRPLSERPQASRGGERWVRPSPAALRRNTPAPSAAPYPAAPFSGVPRDAHPGAEWFDASQRELMKEVSVRIRRLRLIAPLAAALTLSLLGILFAFAVEPNAEEEAIGTFLLALPPTAISWWAVLSLRRWLRSRGIGLMRALRAKKHVTFSLHGTRQLASEGVAVPAEVLRGPIGHVLWQAARDRDAVEKVVSGLSAADRKQLPDVLPTVRALIDRIVSLAPSLHDLDRDVKMEDLALLEQRIAKAESDNARGAGSERTVQLLKRQHAAVLDLVSRRDILQAQIESAAILLQNIKLDLRRVGAGGMSVSIGDVNNATQEARALSREIGHVLSAAEDVRRM
jgi:serine/threonine-protein kinase